MSKPKLTEQDVKNEINALEQEELRLFRSYNRHAKSKVKLTVLIDLQTIINKLEILRKLINK